MMAYFKVQAIYLELLMEKHKKLRLLNALAKTRL
jgi:hypothetical protein